MQLRQVDPSYLEFLRHYEAHVPTKDGRPWLWPVRLNGIDYGIPLTTQETAAGYIGWLRCGANPDHGLYLRYMVPVPASALQPARPLTEELKEELTYWELNRKYIEAEAQVLHRLSGIGQMDRLFQRHSCDYAKLESVYSQWQPGRNAGLFSYPKKEERDMPISKNGKAYYTKEQYEAAKYNSNALEYAQRRGYDLINERGWYKLRDHDSMVFTPDGRWYWNSRGLSGAALEFMMYYENMTITDAVLTLAGEREQTSFRPLERPAPQVEPKARDGGPRYEFRLPEKAQDFKRLFGYLCRDRGLDKTVVQEMIRQDRVYQSEAKLQNGKVLSNATFVYQDAQGKPVGAFQRGMYDRSDAAPYKRDAPGSDKRWGWMLASPFNPATEVRVFEGAIDAASDASLYAMPGMYDRDWRQEPVDRLSLEGLSIQPLQNYLQSHPDVRRVVLMLDGDVPGRRAAREIAGKLAAQGYQVEDRVPPFGKDWNEVLMETRAMAAEQQTASRSEAAPQPEAPEM